MKNEITHRPRALAAIFAVTVTALILSSVESMARMTVAQERALAAAAVQRVVTAPGRIDSIVVIAKRLPLPQLNQQLTLR